MSTVPNNPEAQCACTIEPPHTIGEHYDLVHPPVRRRITDDPNFVPTKRPPPLPATLTARTYVKDFLDEMGEAGRPDNRLPGRPDGNGKDEGPTKPSNPKDVIGSRKLGFSHIPWIALVGLAKALYEGVVKYGRFNWRMCGVRGSIYLDALKRHIAKFEGGQDCDPKSLIHHLDSAMGCLAIMRDAMAHGKYEDDRPPCPDPELTARMIDGEEGFVASLQATFPDAKPYQFTINDTRYIQATQEILP